jgi:hypothetical protein
LVYASDNSERQQKVLKQRLTAPISDPRQPKLSEDDVSLQVRDDNKVASSCECFESECDGDGEAQRRFSSIAPTNSSTGLSNEIYISKLRVVFSRNLRISEKDMHRGFF